MKEFEYLQPKTLAEAIAMRQKYGDALKVMNGGTDVVILLREHLISPDYVMDLKKIPDLKGLRFSKTEGLWIGASVTMNELAAYPDVQTYYPFLAEAASSVGSKQVRNRATCIGNIVNASPLCDTGTPLYACNAIVCTEGAEGKRELPIREFITFVRRTLLKPDELVVGIKVPYQEGLRGVYRKISRRREVDLSTVCGTVVRVGNEYRVAFGSVAPTPLRLDKTEAILNGQPLDRERIEAAASCARTEVKPISDVRAPKEYRLDMVELIVRKGLEALAEGGEQL